MEVGAVKQAFNNEVILLKRKLSQAKIQIIHKLTRKAKQLTVKKTPEATKEKFKRKAESAVKEVLIIKKIKPKDLAIFIVTHKGELKDFLNKPTVDNDKACARLLLHKALQDKYQFLRGRFSDVPIKDLFMSRLERRKLKKEEKEKQKNKKKAKVISSEGDWDVENFNVSDKIKCNDENDHNEGDEVGNDVTGSDKDELQSDDTMSHSGDSEVSPSDNDVSQSDNEVSRSYNDVSVSDDNDHSPYGDDNAMKVRNKNLKNIVEDLNDAESNESKEINLVPCLPYKSTKITKAPIVRNKTVDVDLKTKLITKKNPEKKLRDSNKNKSFNEKILQRKLKKDLDAVATDTKIVDPFFITSTGENYMSVVEPRGPDEVKDEHKQGNRKLRRAMMFGHDIPKPKFRQNNNNYRENNRFNKQNGYEKEDNFRGKFNERGEFSDRKSYNNKFNDRNRFNTENEEEKPEKLHPSWEAKKKKSGILPFEGKKIVFD